MRFSLFRVPVTVEPWFFLGLFFVYSLTVSNGGRSSAGLIAAIAVGVLTLVHEFGHALTARRFGCDVAISLNLFVGWASYASPKPLSRTQSIAISLAGPFAQLAGGVASLVVIHRRYQATDGDIWADAWVGLWWAGIAIAVLNLLPLWPLDGGHVLHRVIEGFVGGVKALRYTLYVTFALLALVLLLGLAARGGNVEFLNEARRDARDGISELRNVSTLAAIGGLFRSLPLIVLDVPWFLLIISGLGSYQTLQQLNGRGSSTPEPVSAVMRAETAGWASGSLPDMPRGWKPSPWLRAYVSARRGDADGAAAALSEVGADGRWVLPDPQSRPELASLVPLLGDQVTLTNRHHAYTLARVLRVYGMPAQFLDLCNALYSRYRDPEVLYLAAGGLAGRGHLDDAMAWLRRAAYEAPDANRLAQDPSLLALHGRADFHELLRQASR